MASPTLPQPDQEVRSWPEPEDGGPKPSVSSSGLSRSVLVSSEMLSRGQLTSTRSNLQVTLFLAQALKGPREVPAVMGSCPPGRDRGVWTQTVEEQETSAPPELLPLAPGHRFSYSYSLLKCPPRGCLQMGLSK